MIRSGAVWLVCAALAASGAAAQGAPDPAEAERQYRVARRLAAEDPAEARAVLERVVALDPTGELADDALVELARLERLTTWADELGAVDLGGAGRATTALERVERTLPRADRAVEARLLRGLLLLEPLPGRDVVAARRALLAVSTDPAAGDWRAPARLALAWIHETRGDLERARGAYVRVLLDLPTPAIERRARHGLGRVLLRAGEAGHAAAELDLAVGLGGPGGAETVLRDRELALRRVLERSGGVRAAPPVLRASVEARGAAGFVALADGGVAIADRRTERVLFYAADGTPTAERPLADVQQIGPDPYGRGVIAAAGASLFRLTRAGVWVPFATLGGFERPTALAAGRSGLVWIVDRKGERLGTVTAGGGTIEVVWAPAEIRIAALAVDGPRAIVADRRGALLRVDPDGATTPFAPRAGVERPIDLAVDASGRIAVLDGKSGSVTLVDGERTFAVVRPEPEAFRRPSALGLGADGALHLLDASAGLWGRWP